jgi:hypothetical protein
MMKTNRILLSAMIVLLGMQVFAQEHKAPEFQLPMGARSMILVNPISDEEISASDLVSSLLPVGTPFSNVTISDETSLGAFSGGNGANLDLNQGVLIGNGCLENFIVGENNCDNVGLPGDSDLDNLGAGYETYDAVYLEFDFVPDFNTLQFKIIYATEETSDEWDEPCGIFVDGSNIALLPGGSDEISTRTIWGTPYFFENTDVSAYISYYSSTFSISAPVTAGETHHVKIAISDGYDHSVNTYLFVEGRSFPSAVPFAWWSVALGLALIIGFTSYRFMTIHRG